MCYLHNFILVLHGQFASFKAILSFHGLFSSKDLLLSGVFSEMSVESVDLTRWRSVLR